MSLPKGHIATNPLEINAHGKHADLIAGTSFGSHQMRIDPYGNVIDEQLNFSKNFLRAEDPRCTAMGGYVPVNMHGHKI